MPFEQAIARYRKLYAKLLRFYPKPYRERFGEGMEQTFNDLCRERKQAGDGLFAFALWMYVETSAEIVRENMRSIFMQKNIMRIALGADMKTPQKLGLVAVMVFVVSHFLPAYGGGSGFASFQVCWNTLLGQDTQFLSGVWFYYSGFAISNITFPILVAALFVTRKGRKLSAAVAVVSFLHVLSWPVLHLFENPSNLAKVKIGYYVWLVAYGLLAAGHLWKEPRPTLESISSALPVA